MSIQARDHYRITELAQMAKVLKGVLVAEKLYAVSMRNERLAENGESDAVTVATNTAQQNDMAIRMHENLVIPPIQAERIILQERGMTCGFSYLYYFFVA